MVLNCVLNIVTLIVQKKNFIADDSFASWTELPLHARSQNLNVCNQFKLADEC